MTTPSENTPVADSTGGSGGRPRSEDRNADGLLPIAEAKIHLRAVRENWFKDGRWPTEATAEELDQLPLTMKTKAAKTVYKGLDDPKSAHIHVRSVIAMEDQNMKQEARDNPRPIEHVHEHHVDVTIEQRRTEVVGILAALCDRAGISPSEDLLGTERQSSLPAHSNGQAAAVPPAGV